MDITRLEQMKRVINTLPINDSSQQDYCTLEYCVHVSNIFIYGFLDRLCHETLNNIDDLEERMCLSLKYFETWSETVEKKKGKQKEHNKKDENKDRQDKTDYGKAFIDIKTFSNLKVAISGFFKYTRAELLRQNGPLYVPLFYANQSSIESTFSKCHSINADTVRSFQEQVGILDWTRDVNNELKNSSNKCYLDDETKILFDTKPEDVLGRSMDKRKAEVEKWLPNNDITNNDEDIEIPIAIEEELCTSLDSPVPSNL